MITPISVDEDKYPESKARIGYSNMLKTAETTERLAMLTPTTYERYTFTAAAVTVKFQLTTAANVDFVAIGAHNSGDISGGAVFNISYATTIGGSLTLIESVTALTNDEIMITFDSLNVAEIAIEKEASTAGIEIGVVMAGQALVMTQPMFGGHSPLSMSSKTIYDNSKSVDGNFIGRNIERQGGESQFNWRNLDDLWVRSEFKPFIESAKKYPFFIKWRPDYYDEVFYCWSSKDIKPRNQGGGTRLMSVSVSVGSYSGI